MLITVEYRFPDGSSQSLDSLSQVDATAAVQDFPWDEQLAVFNQGLDLVSPEVGFTRYVNTATQDDLEAYASVLKDENGGWIVVSGVTMPGRFLGVLPITKKADILMDEITWQDVQSFIQRFYQDSRAELFAWMKSQE